MSMNAPLNSQDYEPVSSAANVASYGSFVGINAPINHKPVNDSTSDLSARLWVALTLSLAFTVFECHTAFTSHSIILFADAMLYVVDLIFFPLTIAALHVKSNAITPFGRHRYHVVIQIFILACLWVAMVIIIIFSTIRLVNNLELIPVEGRMVLIVGAASLVVRLLRWYILVRGLDTREAVRSGKVDSSLKAILSGLL